MDFARQIAASTIGFAIYLSINAISIWGGFFPLLPIEFQTNEILIAFFIAQAATFSMVIAASSLIAFRSPNRLRRTPAGFYPAAVFIGSACLIFSMYFETHTLALVIAGGVLLGGGCAGLFTAWQTVFAAMPAGRGTLCLVSGTIAAPFIYLVVNLAPEAIAAFLVPLFLAPLCGTCLSIASGYSDFEQPMFEDKPSENSSVYLQVVKDHWRSALCLGALGFASGIARGVAVHDDSIVLFINEASLVGMLVSAAIMLVVCCMRQIRIDLSDAFRIVYPALITGFLLVPILGSSYLTAFVTLTYFAFSLIQMLLMMQSAQISRNRGVHPAFVFCFFAGIACFMQSIGFAAGWFGNLPGANGSPLFFISHVATFALSMSMFLAIGSSLKESVLRGSASSDAIELILSTENFPVLKKIGARAQTLAKLSDAQGDGLSSKKRDAIPRQKAYRLGNAEDNDLLDTTSRRCQMLKNRYGLSIRETEIAELLVRGHTAPAMASKLVISEHTVKTHTKRIYAKLGIHKKQELLELMDEIELDDM